MDLDLNLLKTFIAVYENKSIFAASKKLYISQPAVTNSIKRLENFLNGKLFIRTPKGVEPTLEGRDFYSDCISALQLIDKGINKIKSYNLLEKGQLHIGSSSTIIRILLVPFITAFSKRYPKINITITDGISSELITLLQKNEIDLAIMSEPIAFEDAFDKTIITKTTDCFICSYNFKHDFVKKQDIKNFPIVVQKKPSNNRDGFEKMCIDNDLDLKPNYEMTSFGLITDFVEKDLGIGFTIKDFVQTAIKNKSVKVLNTDLIIKPRKVFALTSKGQTSSFVCKAFIEELVESFN